jgi:hypothetical protein
MTPDPDDHDDDDHEATSLSEADIAGIQTTLESGPSVGAPPTVGLGRLFFRSVEAVSPSDTWKGILDALNDMTIPPTIADQLRSHFNELGFTMKNELLPDPNELTKIRHYTAATRKDFKLAILHLPSWFLQMPDTVGNLKLAVEKITDHHGRIISQDIDITAGGYVTALKSMSKRELSWSFVAWGFIKEVINGTMRLEDALGISLPAPVDPEHAAGADHADLELQLGDGDQETIVRIFVTRAGVNPQFFETLILQADWSDDFKTEMRSGLSNDAKASALHVLRLLLTWNRYGAPSEKTSDTYLGWVLLRLLKLLGNPAGAQIAKIIVDNRLVARDSDIQPAKDRMRTGG